MTEPQLPDQVLEDRRLEELRRRRSEMREAMEALEAALARPVVAAGPAWSERVHVALVELSVDLRDHIDMTEGPDGIHEQIVKAAPRLAHGVTQLSADHSRLREILDQALASAGGPTAEDHVERTREYGTALLGRLVRHRQHSSDLIFEAFQVDIGGET
ncbi:MAG: hypothetical protein M3325_09860 [Actinomycetota bacterium]|nr:hypothetical protein [Actinomycetota bacterium]